MPCVEERAVPGLDIAGKKSKVSKIEDESRNGNERAGIRSLHPFSAWKKRKKNGLAWAKVRTVPADPRERGSSPPGRLQPWEGAESAASQWGGKGGGK